MRELIFRGKRLDNGEWVQGRSILTLITGQPEELKVYIPQSGELFSAEEGKTTGNLFSINGTFYKVDPKTIGQYTGLKDENGTLIFEGDIIEFEDLGEEGWEYKEGFNFTNRAKVTLENYRVELTDWYSDNSARLDEMNEYWDAFVDGFEFCEVIGNCHDNPELLKRSKNKCVLIIFQ